MVWIKSNAFDDATKSALIRSLEATVAFKQARTRTSARIGSNTSAANGSGRRTSPKCGCVTRAALLIST